MRLWHAYSESTRLPELAPSLPNNTVFVFRKQEAEKTDTKAAQMYREVATTAALVFAFFTAIRLACVDGAR